MNDIYCAAHTQTVKHHKRDMRPIYTEHAVNFSNTSDKVQTYHLKYEHHFQENTRTMDFLPFEIDITLQPGQSYVHEKQLADKVKNMYPGLFNIIAKTSIYREGTLRKSITCYAIYNVV